MKKTVIFLSIAILFSIKGFAQTKSIDIDNLWFTYSYRHLPEMPLNPLYFNYAVKVTTNGAQRGGISKEELIDLVHIAGQVRVEDPSVADVVMELTTGNIMVSSRDVRERKVENKDRDGKVTSVNHYFKVVVTYTFEASYLVRKGDEILLKGEMYNKMNYMSYESQEYTTHQAAAAFWNDNKDALVAQFYRDLSIKSATSLSNIVSSRYGFIPLTQQRDILKTTDEKKHNENEAFKTHTATLKDALMAMTPDAPLDRDAIKGVINYYESIPERYADPKHKADVRIRYAAFFNLCKIYYYLDEPEKVAEYANLITSNGYDAKDGAKLIKEAEELKAAFNKTGIPTRHFIPEEYFSSKE